MNTRDEYDQDISTITRLFIVCMLAINAVDFLRLIAYVEIKKQNIFLDSERQLS